MGFEGVRRVSKAFCHFSIFHNISLLFCRWKEKALHHDGPTLGAYNWTEIERYDTTDLQLLLKDLEPFTRYEILLQAYNQFGRGPVAKIEAETGEKGTRDQAEISNFPAII